MNIAYGPSSREKLDIYGNDLKPESPLLVYVHGGYWQRYDKWSSAQIVTPLVQNGIRVIVVGYELCPAVGVGDIIAQIQKAFAWIAKYVEQNSIKALSLAGHSAGAHLIACALREEFVKAIALDVKVFVYLISGLYDLSEVRYCETINLNNMFAITDDNVRQLSPQFRNFAHLNEMDIKIHVFVGEFESEKFKQQSRDFGQIALKDLRFSLFEVCDALDHFDIVEKLAETDYKITRLIVQNAIEK